MHSLKAQIPNTPKEFPVTATSTPPELLILETCCVKDQSCVRSHEFKV